MRQIWIVPCSRTYGTDIPREEEERFLYKHVNDTERKSRETTDVGKKRDLISRARKTPEEDSIRLRKVRDVISFGTLGDSWSPSDPIECEILPWWRTFPSSRTTDKMWYSPSKTARMEEHLREDDRTQRDDSGLATADDDSGFLSVGNVQFCSGEIRDAGLQPRQTPTEALQDEGQQQQRVASMMPEMAIASSSPTITTAKESIRTVDSGVVDVELSDDLDRLTLSRGPIQPEPEILELSHVDVASARGQQHQQGDDQCSTINKDLWQFYSKDGDGDTQLHIAIMQGYVEAALILISLAPHPRLLNIINDHLQSPLHLAVLTQQPLIVRRLVLAGADLSLRNFRGNTALHLACANGDLACAKALTDSLYPMERNKLMPGQKIPALPQNLEQINYNGEMCLHVAVANGHVNLVRLLLRLGADLEAKECLAGRTALHLAVERKCWPIINFLLKECKPCLNTKTYSGLTAYQLALYTDRLLARELLQHGAKPEPLPDSDSESSDDELNYMSPILQMKNVQRLKV